MVKTFEGFLNKKNKDIFKTVIDRFNKVSHFTKLSNSRALNQDYHNLVRKYNISYGNVIRDLSMNIIDELDQELKDLISKYPEIIPEK